MPPTMAPLIQPLALAAGTSEREREIAAAPAAAMISFMGSLRVCSFEVQRTPGRLRSVCARSLHRQSPRPQRVRLISAAACHLADYEDFHPAHTAPPA